MKHISNIYADPTLPKEQATQLEYRDVLYEIQRISEEELESIKKKLEQMK